MSKINCSEQVQVITFTNVKYYTTMKVPSIEGTPERKSNQDQNRQAGNRPGEPYHTSIIQSTTLAQSKPRAGIDLKPLKDKQTATVLSNLSHEHFDQQKWPPSLPTHKKRAKFTHRVKKITVIQYVTKSATLNTTGIVCGMSSGLSCKTKTGNSTPCSFNTLNTN